jgi:alkaline phosphatase
MAQATTSAEEALAESGGRAAAARGLRRREFLAAGAAAAAGLALPVRAGASRPPGDAPRSILFLVSDGMSCGVLDLAESFSKLVRGHGTAWCALMADRAAVHGLQETHSLDSTVTDSAAASSAWGSGCRGFNGMINTFPDGRTVTPISRLVKEAGKAMGLVTTATVTHATPAGFAACVPKRDMEDAIARQYLSGNMDVILGGGAKFFDPAQREDGEDVFAAFADGGHAVCRTPREMQEAAAQGRRILGTFADGHLPYVIDRADGVPSLADMTRAALDVLARNPNGFLCQIEGARIDHAAHNNDAPALLREQLAFDDALRVAMDFARRDGETLVVVTSDHGNANPGLNGWGKAYTGSPARFATLTRATRSADAILQWIKSSHEAGAPSHEAFASAFETMAGFRPTAGEQDILVRAAIGGEIPNWSHQANTFKGVFGQIAGNHNGIGWTGVTHTSDHTITTAFGPGSGAFHGLLRNDAVFAFLTGALGITHRNEPFAGKLPAV